MNAIPKVLMIASLLVPAAAAAQTGGAASLPLRAESRISFDGTSTVRSWSCKANKVSGTVDLSAGQSAVLVLKGQKAVREASLTVPVATLGCGNGTMDNHMKNALKASANPNIKFNLGSYELSGTTAKLNGTLSIAGRENPITLNGTVSQDANGRLHFTGSKEIKMTQWGVTPPTLMMGTMKVGDALTVNYDVVVQP